MFEQQDTMLDNAAGIVTCKSPQNIEAGCCGKVQVIRTVQQ